MKFFTDNSINNEFLLIKIKDYLKLKNKEIWNEILIDPGVYELQNSKEYSWEKEVNMYYFLNSLPKNHYFSFDYPPDMNLKYEDYFIKRTWENALEFSMHPNYITTIQYKLNHYWDFIEWFDKYNDLEITSGIIGLGNMCRIIMKKHFILHALDYAFSHMKHKRFHIYGLSLRYIPYAYKLSRKFKIELSIDSTKWTRAIHPLRKKINMIHANTKIQRQLFFYYYLQEIKKRGVKLENEKYKYTN